METYWTSVDRVEQQVAGVGALHELAVDAGRSSQRRADAAGQLVGRHEHRAERCRGLPGLALQPLRVRNCQSRHRDVVEHREAGDRRRRRGGVSAADRRTDDDRELGLPVERVGLGGQLDVVVGPTSASAYLANSVGCSGSSRPISRMWVR